MWPTAICSNMLHLSFALSCSFQNSAWLPVIGQMFTDIMTYGQVRMSVYFVYPQTVPAAPGLHFWVYHYIRFNKQKEADMLAVSSLTIASASSAHSHNFWCEAIQSFVSAAYLQTDPVSEPGGHVWNCCVQTCCRRQRGCGCLRWPWWTPPPVKNTKLYSSHDGECLHKELFLSNIGSVFIPKRFK